MTRTKKKRGVGHFDPGRGTAQQRGKGTTSVVPQIHVGKEIRALAPESSYAAIVCG